MGWDNQKVIQSFQLNISHQAALLKVIQEVRLYVLLLGYLRHYRYFLTWGKLDLTKTLIFTEMSISTSL